jgi:hypothetical protein
MDWFSMVLSSFTKPDHFWLHEVDLFFVAKYVLLFFLWQLEHRVGPGREAECQWELKDCIAVQKLLETTLDDGDAASRWRQQCANMFPYSTYFKGVKSSATRGLPSIQGSNHLGNGDVDSRSSHDMSKELE